MGGQSRGCIALARNLCGLGEAVLMQRKVVYGIQVPEIHGAGTSIPFCS
jgi:hypothetical protein